VTTPNEDVSNSKTEIRAMVADRRSTLRVGATDVRASAVAIHGIEMVRAECAPGSIIAAFSSFGNEPPTDLLVSGLVDMGYRVILPRVINATEMTWHHYDGTWTTDTLGISTPATNDEVSMTNCALIFIPAVAASPDGRRLGRGGGYYDRMLEKLPTHAEGGPFRCAVIDAPGLLANGVIPMDSHDAWVDGILVG
jgi:5-formyltetrahydrofolate cyclo-ligase